MKKYFSLLAAAMLTFGFTACEDVPAPYVNPNDSVVAPSDPSTPGNTDVIVEEAFATSLGSFQNFTVSGEGSWIIDYSTAKATGYDNTSKVTTAGTYLLVSKQLDLTEVTEAFVTYEYILCYNKGKDNQRFVITTDVDKPVAEATWVTLNNDHFDNMNLPEEEKGEKWSKFSTATFNIPAEYMGKVVKVAFYYNTNATSGSTWEVKNFSMKKGSVAAEEQPVVGEQKLPYKEAFSSTLGTFTSQTVSGQGAWIIDYQTAKATGYDNATQVTTAGTYYLVSAVVDLEGVSAAHIAYEYILRYNAGDENQQLFITTDIDKDAKDAAWTLLKKDHTEGTDWTTFATADVAVPADFLGKKVRVAFLYNAPADDCSTWEVKNFSMSEGAPGDAPTGGDVVGDLTSFNGDFETWVDGLPNNWKTASTAGNASLSQSTDAHGGSYSVRVGGTNSANKRIGYKEMTLKAGTYTMKFYAKAATATGASVRPGYTPVDDANKVGSYVYGDYTNNISSTEWVEVTHEFTLAADTRLSLVIMNSKNPGADVLIDDFTLTTNDGGILDGGATDTPDTPEQGGDAPEVPSTGSEIQNGDFELWDGATPLYWKSKSTASSATLSQSTDARGGQYAVCVQANSASNKRLAYQETTLAAGTYTMSFYAKAATSAVSSVRPGYVPMKADGTADSSNYKYGDYVNDIPGEWTLVTHTFTLDAETTLCLVIMNPKTSSSHTASDVLIDDFTLVKQ